MIQATVNPATAIKFMQSAIAASDKAATAAANDSAFAGRKALKDAAIAIGFGARMIRVTKATEKRSEAVIRDRGWFRGNLQGKVHAMGAGIQSLSGEHVTIPFNQKFAGERKTMWALGTGFMARMRSGKLGVFMRDGSKRLPITLLYSVRDGAEVDKVIDAGVNAAYVESVHSFHKRFAQILAKG